MKQLKHIAATLSLCSALAACDTDQDPKQTAQDQGQADMHIGADMAQDMQSDQGDELPDALKLLSLSVDGPRNLNANSPAQLRFDVTFEGAPQTEAMLSFIFGDERIEKRITLEPQLNVTPPAKADHRGLVDVELSYKDQRVTLDGGLRYGDSIAANIPADAPQVEQLEGLTQADEVWPIGANRLLVMQRARTAPNPAALTQAQDTLSLYERDDQGKLKLVATRSCCQEVIVVVNEIPVRSPLAPPDSPTPGQRQLIPMVFNQDKIEDGEPLLTLPPKAELLGIEAYQGQLFALALLEDAQGKQRLGLFDVQSGKLYQPPQLDKLEPASARLVSADNNPDGPAISGLSAGPDGAQLQLILKAATDGQQQLISLETIKGLDAKSATFGVVLALNNTKKDAPVGLLYNVISDKYSRMEGGVLEPPAIPGGAPRYERQLGPFEQDGIDHTTFNSILKGSLSAIANPPGDAATAASAVLALGDEPCPPAATGCALPRTWLLDLPLDGSRSPVEPILLNTSTIIEREPFSRAHITQISRNRDKTVTIRMIIDAKEITYGYDPNSALSVKDDIATPGASAVTHIAHVKPSIESAAPHPTIYFSRSSPKLSKPANAPVTTPDRGFGESSEFEIDNGKLTTFSVLPLADGSIVERVIGVYLTNNDEGGDDLILHVNLAEKSGAKRPALWRVSGAELKALSETNNTLTPKQGIARLPEGFIVRTLVAHGDEVFVLGAQSIDALYSADGQLNSGLFGTSVARTGDGQAAMTSLLTPAQVRQQLGDRAEVSLASLVRLGPAHSALLLRDHQNMREAAQLFLLQPKQAPKLLKLPEAPGAGVTYWGAGQSADGAPTLIFGYDDAAAPVLVTLDPATTQLTISAALTGLDPELAATLSAQTQLAGLNALRDPAQRTISADLNNDGLRDLLISDAPPLGDATNPTQLVQGYHYVLLGQPDGTFALEALTPSIGYDLQQVSALSAHPRLKARLRRKM